VGPGGLAEFRISTENIREFVSMEENIVVFELYIWRMVIGWSSLKMWGLTSAQTMSFTWTSFQEFPGSR
jgi:hypothetical protein